MTEALARKAEIVKLARLLEIEADQLAPLEQVDAESLRALRERTTELLFEGHMGAFRRAVHASGLLPAGVSATIAERAFGPLLCARLAGLVGTERAVAVAGHLSPDFLADVAVHMDPRRASQVIARVPAGLVGEITERLAERGEHVVMGRFAGHLTDEALRRTFDQLEDRDLLQIGFTLEEGLDRAVGLLPDRRMEGVLRCAAHADLWAEGLTLLHDLDEPRRAQVARIVQRDPELRDELLGAAAEHGLGDEAHKLLDHAA
jgi:hypothetical protein